MSGDETIIQWIKIALAMIAIILLVSFTRDVMQKLDEITKSLSTTSSVDVPL